MKEKMATVMFPVVKLQKRNITIAYTDYCESRSETFNAHENKPTKVSKS